MGKIAIDTLGDIHYTLSMINNNRTKAGNKWEVGNVVKVGFMTLRVLGARAEKDYLPDIYTLESLDGSKKYEFIPHNGLSRI